MSLTERDATPEFPLGLL